MHRYHPALGIPPWVRVPDVSAALDWSGHAREEALKDRLPTPAAVRTGAAELFEVVTDDRFRVVKLGVRVPADGDRDLCMVIAPEGKAWRVVTCWANDRADDHKTLRPSEYETWTSPASSAGTERSHATGCTP